MNEERLDKLLVKREYASTRIEAERMIKEVGVKVNGKLVTKTGKKFPLDATIDVANETTPWVSIDALKLDDALKKWTPKITNGYFLDIGAGVGGFSDVLLKNKAKRIYAIEMEKNKIHPTIESNKNVINIDNTHVRELTTTLIPELVDGCVIDVSYVSLENIFPFVQPFLKKDGFIIAVVKPQFEVGKKNVDKNGLVKNRKLFTDVLRNVKKQASLANLTYIDDIPCSILGENGNEEILMYLKKN